MPEVFIRLAQGTKDRFDPFFCVCQTVSPWIKNDIAQSKNISMSFGQAFGTPRRFLRNLTKNDGNGLVVTIIRQGNNPIYNSVKRLI